MEEKKLYNAVRKIITLADGCLLYTSDAADD